MIKRKFAKGSRKTIKRPGEMNRLETEYAAHLEGLKKSGEISDFGYEALKFRLANKTFFTPDFMVIMPCGTIEMHEVKAFWKTKNGPHVEAAASAKIKIAAECFPFKFALVFKTKELGWQRQDY